MGKSLSELGSASTLSNSDLFLIDSDGVSKSMTVGTLQNTMKPSTAGTADKAVADSEEQNIASTYIKALSINDHKLTALNGASSAVCSFDLPDTTYNTGSTSTAGITKLYNSTGENTDGTMTQAAITAALAAIDSFDIAVVDTLPSSNINTHCIYLIPGSGNGNNTRDEYIYVNGNWEKIGTTVADLSNIKYVSSLTQSGSTVTVTRNNETPQSINTGVMEISLGNGFAASTITDTGTISLPTVTAASTAGPTESVTGSEGSTIQIPKVIVDEFGRVTSLTSFTLTNKDTTYSNGTGLDLSNGTFSLSTCVAGDSAGPSSDVTGSNGSTVAIPKLTVDNYGRVTSIGSQTFTAQDHTYTNGNGLDLSDGTFSLSTCVAGDSAGPTENVTGSNGSTVSIPKLTVDNYGRVTSIGSQTFTAQDHTYTNGNGLNLNNGEFSLADSGATSGTYGPSANVTGSEGNTINIPSLTVDSTGRITSIENKTYTSKDTTYSTGTTSVAGLTKLYTSSGDNTDGTMTQSAIKEAISTAISAINSFEIAVVNSLPSTGISTHTIYLIADPNSATQNAYDEYIYVNNNWEKIGTTVTDLSNIKYVSGVSQSGSTVTVSRNNETDQTFNVGVTEIVLGEGFTASTITGTGTISLPNSGATSGTYGPSANVTGSEGNTINIPSLTVDAKGRVTGISNKVYTSKDTTYTNGAGISLSNGTFSLSTCVTGASAGPSSDVTGSNGSTVSIPKLTVDNYGRVTAIGSQKFTAQDHTYTPASLGSGYGTCGTAAATAAKTVTMSGYELVTGGVVSIKFTNAVPASATMAINSKAAKAIYHKGAAIAAGVINAGDTAMFMYDGSYYHLIAIDTSLSVIDCGDEG